MEEIFVRILPMNWVTHVQTVIHFVDAFIFIFAKTRSNGINELLE